MKIVCLLRHDELRPLLATCTRLRQAASACITVHFNFCTPEPVRGEGEENAAVLRSPSPHYMRAAIALTLDQPGGPAAPHRNKQRRRRPLPALPMPPDPEAGAGAEAAAGQAAAATPAAPDAAEAEEEEEDTPGGSALFADSLLEPQPLDAAKHGLRLSFRSPME
jgi:hypothetical protein